MATSHKRHTAGGGDMLAWDLLCAARSEASVLVTGSTPAGREQHARLVHENSTRRDGPFVTANQHNSLREAFESAARGTIFIDNLDTMPPGRQEELRSLLESMGHEGVVRSARSARIVVGTSRTLGPSIQSREFDEGLYYRLNMIHLELPDGG